MPDLNDDLTAMLRERAEHAPATPAPTEALVRRVRRRRATRLAVTTVAGAASLGAVAVVGAAALAPTPTTVRPGAPSSSRITDDRYEFCDLANPAPSLVVTVHATEQKFSEGCYVVAAGATRIRFANPNPLPHDLVVVEEGTDAVLATTPVIQPGGAAQTHELSFGLKTGDYRLTCRVHPAMHAQLVVR